MAAQAPRARRRRPRRPAAALRALCAAAGAAAENGPSTTYRALRDADGQPVQFGTSHWQVVTATAFRAGGAFPDKCGAALAPRWHYGALASPAAETCCGPGLACANAANVVYEADRGRVRLSAGPGKGNAQMFSCCCGDGACSGCTADTWFDGANGQANYTEGDAMFYVGELEASRDGNESDRFPANAVLGLYLYTPNMTEGWAGNVDTTNELDIEFAGWGSMPKLHMSTWAGHRLPEHCSARDASRLDCVTTSLVGEDSQFAFKDWMEVENGMWSIVYKGVGQAVWSPSMDSVKVHNLLHTDPVDDGKHVFGKCQVIRKYTTVICYGVFTYEQCDKNADGTEPFVSGTQSENGSFLRCVKDNGGNKFRGEIPTAAMKVGMNIWRSGTDAMTHDVSVYINNFLWKPKQGTEQGTECMGSTSELCATPCCSSCSGRGAPSEGPQASPTASPTCPDGPCLHEDTGTIVTVNESTSSIASRAAYPSILWMEAAAMFLLWCGAL